MTDPELLLRACWNTPVHLAVVDGPDAGWCVPVGPRPAVVGRGPEADLVLADPALSRSHLACRRRDGVVQVRDLASRNGTWSAARRGQRRGGSRRGGAGDGEPAPRHRRRRRVGRRWRTVGVGTRLHAGASCLEVRARPGLVGATTGGGRSRRRRPGDLPAWPVARLVTPLLMGLLSVPLLVTSLGSGPLPPWRLALLVAVPALLVASVVAAVVGHRRDRAPDAARPAPEPPVAVDPPGFALHAVGPAEAGRARRDAGGPLTLDLGATAVELADEHGSLALVGDPRAVAAMARWVRVQLVAAGQDRAVDPVPVWEDVPAGASRVVDVPVDHPRRVSDAWYRVVAGALAAGGGTPLPDAVPLAALLGPPSASRVLDAWRSADGALAAPLGVGPDGTFVLDLAADGPHALVAGTTGAGKSELLLAWVLALASRYPPRHLALVLVDYKGGATFGPVAALPHVTGVLTDLDGASTARALASLRAELHRREAAFAASGARDLGQFRQRAPSSPMPRLLVVVDEFRTLATELPAFLDGLVRLAAQGRSLGIHLVVATQRPAGSVTAEMRANLGVRVCLRVLAPADSLDVVDVVDAAGLPPSPGRALVRTHTLTTAQLAWTGGEAAGDALAAAVRDAGLAAGRDLATAALVLTRTPWAPPLPDRALRSREGAALVTDVPAEQRLGTWSWDGAPLLVTGGPATGRTTALASVLADRVRAGDTVHVVAAGPGLLPSGASRAGPALGTRVGPDDPRRLARLLTLLEAGASPPGTALVIDDVEEVVDALDRVGGPATGADRVLGLLRRSGALGLHVALAASPPGSRWTSLARHHLALGARDAGSAALAGIPRDLALAGAPPGRGVLLGDDGPLLVQVSVDDEPWPATGAVAAPRLVPLPHPLALAGLAERVGSAGRGADGVVLGVGGDAADVVAPPLEAGRPWLVLGSAASGRTAVLDVVAAALAARNEPVQRVDPGTERLPEAPGVVTWLVDDAEGLAPELSEELAARLTARRDRCVAVSTTEAVAATYRGLLALVRDARTLVLLGTAANGTVAGVDTRAARDPAHAHLPGRGVLVAAGRATPLQLARAEPVAGGRAAG